MRPKRRRVWAISLGATGQTNSFEEEERFFCRVQDPRRPSQWGPGPPASRVLARSTAPWTPPLDMGVITDHPSQEAPSSKGPPRPGYFAVGHDLAATYTPVAARARQTASGENGLLGRGRDPCWAGCYDSSDNNTVRYHDSRKQWYI